MVRFCADTSSCLDHHSHAVVAAEGGAFPALLAIGQAVKQAGGGSADGMHSRSLLLLLAATVGAFGLSPRSLPAEELGQVMGLFASIFEGVLPKARSSRPPKFPQNPWGPCQSIPLKVANAADDNMTGAGHMNPMHDQGMDSCRPGGAVRGVLGPGEGSDGAAAPLPARGQKPLPCRALFLIFHPNTIILAYCMTPDSFRQA